MIRLDVYKRQAYNNYLEKGTEENSKKYEDSYALYLEAIDKYIMDSLYKKVKSNTATNFERDAIAKDVYKRQVYRRKI